MDERKDRWNMEEMTNIFEFIISTAPSNILFFPLTTKAHAQDCGISQTTRVTSILPSKANQMKAYLTRQDSDVHRCISISVYSGFTHTVANKSSWMLLIPIPLPPVPKQGQTIFVLKTNTKSERYLVKKLCSAIRNRTFNSCRRFCQNIPVELQEDGRRRESLTHASQPVHCPAGSGSEWVGVTGGLRYHGA